MHVALVALLALYQLISFWQILYMVDEFALHGSVLPLLTNVNLKDMFNVQDPLERLVILDSIKNLSVYHCCRYGYHHVQDFRTKTLGTSILRYHCTIETAQKINTREFFTFQ